MRFSVEKMLKNLSIKILKLQLKIYLYTTITLTEYGYCIKQELEFNKHKKLKRCNIDFHEEVGRSGAALHTI